MAPAKTLHSPPAPPTLCTIPKEMKAFFVTLYTKHYSCVITYIRYLFKKAFGTFLGTIPKIVPSLCFAMSTFCVTYSVIQKHSKLGSVGKMSNLVH